MSDQERESLVSSIEQLQQHQMVLAKYIAGMKRRLDDLTEQFKNRPELQQITSLQDALAQVHRQLDERSPLPEAPVEVVSLRTEVATSVDEIQQQPIQVQPYNYHLVFDRSGSRAVLMEALEKAQERLIIVCPWLNRNSIDADLLQKFTDCLNRNCRIDIGWGHLSDRRRLGKGWRYDALKDLRQLERDYPEHFRLKLLGTHEKFLVCDSTFAMLGSHNLLTSSAQSAEREAGLRTTDPHIIQGLINRFDGAEVQDAQAINESLIAGSVSLDDAEALDAQDVSEGTDAILVNPDHEETDQDIDDSAEDDQGTAIDAEEFLRRYNEKERNFTGVNLARVDLTSKNLSSANLIQANLSGANLTKANLCSAKLLQANLSEANLSQANLSEADLTAASLSRANLIQANLGYTNLTATDLSKAKLTNVTLNSTTLSGANLTGVNLVGVNLQEVNLSGADLSGANLCGANLSYNASLSGVNLTSADLRGANLENANLEKANLKEANLSGANLNGANLSGAIMPDGTTHDYVLK